MVVLQGKACTFAILQELFGTKEFLPHTALGEMILSRFCVCSKVCKRILAMFFGFNWKNTNMVCGNTSTEGPSEGQSLGNALFWEAKWILLWNVLVSLQSRIDVYAGHTPAGSSVQNIIHWLQVNLLRFLPVPNRESLVPCGQPALLAAARHTFVRFLGGLFSPPSKMLGRFLSPVAPKGWICQEKHLELRTLHLQQAHSRGLISNQLHCCPAA